MGEYLNLGSPAEGLRNATTDIILGEMAGDRNFDGQMKTRRLSGFVGSAHEGSGGAATGIATVSIREDMSQNK